MGAMTSAAAAFQTGSAAVSQTKGMKDEFKNISEQAKQAENKLAANKVAKEQVKNMNKEELGGLSKKEMKKSISNDLQAKMNAEKPEFTSKDLLSGKADDQITKSKDSIKKTFDTELKNASGKKATNKARSATVKSYADKAAKTRVKSTVSFDSLSKNLMNTAAVFAQNKEQENSGVGFAPYTLHTNSRYQQDLKRMQARQAAYA